MEEALEILWTYARREPLDSNGETDIAVANYEVYILGFQSLI